MFVGRLLALAVLADEEGVPKEFEFLGTVGLIVEIFFFFLRQRVQLVVAGILVAQGLLMMFDLAYDFVDVFLHPRARLADLGEPADLEDEAVPEPYPFPGVEPVAPELVFLL